MILWKNILSALHPLYTARRYGVTIEGYAGGIWNCFWFRRNAERRFEDMKDEGAHARLRDGWVGDENGQPRILRRQDNIREWGGRIPDSAEQMKRQSQLRFGLPNRKRNAFGTVLSEDGLPIICGHGGSAWLCPRCAEKLRKEDTR